MRRPPTSPTARRLRRVGIAALGAVLVAVGVTAPGTAGRTAAAYTDTATVAAAPISVATAGWTALGVGIPTGAGGIASDDGHLYAANGSDSTAGGVYRLDDGTWTQVGPPLPRAFGVSTSNGSLFATVNGPSATPGAEPQPGVYQLIDGVWTRLGAAQTPLSAPWDMARVGATVYASASSSNLYRIDPDNGNRWTFVASISQLNGLATDGTTLYGANLSAYDGGVFRLSGTSWVRVGPVLTSTYDVAVDDGHVYAATVRGVYELRSGAWEALGTNSPQLAQGIAVLGGSVYANGQMSDIYRYDTPTAP